MMTTTDAGATGQAALLSLAREALAPLYQAPHRAYHGLAHVEAMLDGLQAHAELVGDAPALGLSVWFHDAVYDPRRQDNEARSADLAAALLPGWGAAPPLVDKVRRQVLATQHHDWTDGDPDTAVFLDLDLAILAQPAPVYARYASQVAQEYAWVPEAAYRAGRAGVLRAFLARPQIYFTPHLRAQWEAPARANLQCELAALSGAAGAALGVGD